MRSRRLETRRTRANTCSHETGFFGHRENALPRRRPASSLVPPTSCHVPCMGSRLPATPAAGAGSGTCACRSWVCTLRTPDLATQSHSPSLHTTWPPHWPAIGCSLACYWPAIGLPLAAHWPAIGLPAPVAYGLTSSPLRTGPPRSRPSSFGSSARVRL